MKLLGTGEKDRISEIVKISRSNRSKIKMDDTVLWLDLKITVFEIFKITACESTIDLSVKVKIHILTKDSFI